MQLNEGQRTGLLNDADRQFTLDTDAFGRLDIYVGGELIVGGLTDEQVKDLRDELFKVQGRVTSEAAFVKPPTAREKRMAERRAIIEHGTERERINLALWALRSEGYFALKEGTPTPTLHFPKYAVKFFTPDQYTRNKAVTNSLWINHDGTTEQKRRAVQVLREHNLRAFWNGDDHQCIEVRSDDSIADVGDTVRLDERPTFGTVTTQCTGTSAGKVTIAVGEDGLTIKSQDDVIVMRPVDHAEYVSPAEALPHEREVK